HRGCRRASRSCPGLPWARRGIGRSQSWTCHNPLFFRPEPWTPVPTLVFAPALAAPVVGVVVWFTVGATPAEPDLLVTTGGPVWVLAACVAVNIDGPLLTRFGLALTGVGVPISVAAACAAVKMDGPDVTRVGL